MALSVVKRPQGYILNSYSTIGTFTNGSSIISINVTDWGIISTGSIIYITNNQAIGFWYVTKSANPGEISISEYSGASSYIFIGNGTFNFYFSGATHGWNAVHLPIVYKLSSTLWPSNSVDTVRTVSSYVNDNGCVKLTLSGAITSSVTELEFIKITGTMGGVYQIIAFYSTSIVTINLAYAGAGMTFGTVQYYYNNYRARIRVYGGIKSTHTYTLQKPYALITEQEVKPDSTGIITFNINEFLKQKIDILKNDMLKGTLPNNLDAWCMFYITYAECYDYSAGGYTILDNIGTYIDDSGTFEGYAVNADLPFKNTFSGAMSNYVYENNIYSIVEKFLTPVLYPEITGAFYFDISYIIDENINVTNTLLVQELYRSNSLIQTIYNTIGSGTSNYGVYRSSLTKVGTEDSQNVYVSTFASIIAPTSWTNAICLGIAMSKNATQLIASYLGPGSQNSSAKQLLQSLLPSGTNIQFTINCFISTGGGATNAFTVAFYDEDPCTTGILVGNQTFASLGNGTVNENINITLTGIAKYLVINTNLFTAAGGSNQIILTLPVATVLGVASKISETKTISINSGFFNSGFAPYTNYNVCWLNYLGGFDWKVFQSSADLGVNIEGTKTVNKNIFQNWPNSFGEGSDAIKQETIRSSRQTITLRAENLTSDQITDLFRIKTSPLVQIVTSANDRRTIIPDTSSFVYLKQREKLFSFEFTAEFTDNLSSQGL